MAKDTYLNKKSETARRGVLLLLFFAVFCLGLCVARIGYLTLVKGDVYKCDGWIGEQDRVRFNLADDPATWNLEPPTLDATRDEKCSACELLPVCQGSCSWERELSGWPCHPLKHTLAEYLLDWRSYFGELQLDGGIALLAEPLSADEILAKG